MASLRKLTFGRRNSTAANSEDGGDGDGGGGGGGGEGEQVGMTVLHNVRSHDGQQHTRSRSNTGTNTHGHSCWTLDGDVASVSYSESVPRQPEDSRIELIERRSAGDLHHHHLDDRRSLHSAHSKWTTNSSGAAKSPARLTTASTNASSSLRSRRRRGGAGTVEDRDRVRRIHRVASRYSSLPRYVDANGSRSNKNRYSNVVHDNPFQAPPGSELDPRGPAFSAKAWAQAVLQLQAAEPDKQPPRTAGVAFANLGVSGVAVDSEYQPTVGNAVLRGLESVRDACEWVFGGGGGRRARRKEILKGLDGIVEAGEMMLVLGPPGSGCSTLLKTLAGETHGVSVDEGSYLNYQGICAEQMHHDFRGDAIYTAEQDVHFPSMTVGDTLLFAARARSPRFLVGGIDHEGWAEHMRDVVMAMFGIGHTVDTKVGNEFVRGVSGGERKRVTIAEATLSRAPLQCWDNSTRGLDSANALEFCKNLRVQTEYLGVSACVAIYQASQNVYDIFDKVTVLYDGRQIYFGRCEDAKDYFLDLGFECPQRQTTADFLTSMTSPHERVVRQGYENRVPRTADEFAAVWRASDEYHRLLQDLREYNTKYSFGGEYLERFVESKRAQQARFAAEAFASMLTDIPYKVGNCIIFNVTLYFMTNLRREVSAFFFFLLLSFALTLAMSMLFRTIASVSRTISQAMVPATLLILAIVIFTGFAIPIQYMRGWCRWINWVDPVAYGFEALMANEFHGRQWSCSSFVPGYPGLAPMNKVCDAVGAKPGASYVDGDAYLRTAFRYEYAHRWRDFGAVVGFIFLFMLTYLIATEYISEKRSKGEVLVFRRGYVPNTSTRDDVETAARGQRGSIVGSPGAAGSITKQTSVFHWQNLCYDIKTAGGPKRLLDRVDGWIKPGTLTALMGVSGAGKTTLLDTLAARTTMGVVTGDALLDGRPRNINFQRSTGYVQQQDLHLETSTVREALNFSALLRQPAHVPRQEKLDYAGEVIKLLEMEEYADAVVGVPGEGLNVEQRRRLTIGVELAARPALLFLDEPTSGLDSQTSWAICDLIEKLTKAGQAVLITIHQPSAQLFERFDRLLLLHNGGTTIYFGDIGENSRTVIDYFEARCEESQRCPDQANPAEWLLEVIGAAPGCSSDIDWPRVWRDSPEYDAVCHELLRLREKPPLAKSEDGETASGEAAECREFAAPFGAQMREVTRRVFQQYWRTPTYIYSKFSVCFFSSLFIGLVFLNSPNTIQGLQNQMFAIFMLITIFGQLIQQFMPIFITQRTLYEARERPSKTYSWPTFLMASMIAELPYNTVASLLIYPPFYYLLGLQHRSTTTTTELAVTTATTTSSGSGGGERAGLMFLLVWVTLLFASTLAAAVAAPAATAEAGSNLAQLLVSLSLIFCGVLPPAPLLPPFWRWLNRVSPFTYLVAAALSAAVGGKDVRCAEDEVLRFELPGGGGGGKEELSCEAFLRPWVEAVGGGYAVPMDGDDDNKRMCGYFKYFGARDG
ncbi:ZEB2-regulated ABC transporter 1 [Lasiodiplodia theobromae]|uniref:ZEB2-regulated ABC transporter 1 n=1 Tax=Lasiodiplodia theobromae TaxID=45133 RepID=A0A5N5DK56_9PEZI|nr:ZEB2-regulated ABC transporter 1 [Lasiodiplodia theobromae]